MFGVPPGQPGFEEQKVPTTTAGFPVMSNRENPPYGAGFPSDGVHERSGGYVNEENNILFVSNLPQNTSKSLLHQIFGDFHGFREIRT